MIFIADLNHDLNHWFKSLDLNQLNPDFLRPNYLIKLQAHNNDQAKRN